MKKRNKRGNHKNIRVPKVSNSKQTKITPETKPATSNVEQVKYDKVNALWDKITKASSLLTIFSVIWNIISGIGRVVIDANNALYVETGTLLSSVVLAGVVSPKAIKKYVTEKIRNSRLYRIIAVAFLLFAIMVSIGTCDTKYSQLSEEIEITHLMVRPTASNTFELIARVETSKGNNSLYCTICVNEIVVEDNMTVYQSGSVDGRAIVDVRYQKTVNILRNTEKGENRVIIKLSPYKMKRDCLQDRFAVSGMRSFGIKKIQK